MINNVKRILRLSQESRHVLQKGVIYGILESICGVLPLGILLLFIRKMLNGNLTVGMLIVLTVILIGVYLLQFTFHLKETSITSTVGYDIIAGKRISIAALLKKVPMGLFTGQGVGNILSVMTNELTQIELYAMQMVSKVVSSITTIAISVLFLAFVNPLLCLCYFVGFPVALLINYVIQNLQKKAAKKRMSALENLIDSVVEYSQGIETVRAYNVEDSSQSSIHQSFDRFAANTIYTEAAVIPWMQGYSFFLYIGTALVLYVGINLLAGGALSLTFYFLFCIAGVFFYQPFEILSAYAGVFHTMTESLDRVEGLMQLIPMDEPEQNVPFENYDIAFQNVSFSYGDAAVLTEVSFEVPQNTLTAIVGMSGSGKTTLMQLLMRYWDCNSGVIKIGGKPIQDYKIDSLMSVISVVFQENYLFRDSIYNNITMGKSDATREEVVQAARRACCHNFIEALPDGYDTMVKEGGNSLSGGERQRIAIARAILKDAPIVILDEATSGIDPVNEADIQRAIQELAKGKTVFVIAHKFSAISGADQIIVLEKGRLIEKGTHKRLLKAKGRYASLWNKQQGVDDWKIRWQDEN